MCLYSMEDSRLANIYEMRYKLFCANPTQSSALPPTEDALYWHICRANYQSALLRRALDTGPLPSADGHGWTVGTNDEDPTLTIKWISKPAAPQALLELVSCGCSTGCGSQRCRCRKSNLLCSAACRCTNCTNCEDLSIQTEDDQ